jgi:cytidine deaminase
MANDAEARADTRQEELARSLIPRCYAPYSGFRVAAVLEDSEGRLWGGVNVENQVYGLTICAERSALVEAASAGCRNFVSMLVYSPDGEAWPCGSCRQALLEFCPPDMPVRVLRPDGELMERCLQELLPDAFRLPPRGDRNARPETEGRCPE